MSNGGDWPKKYPWKLLPRRPQHGYLDADGNEWTPDYPTTGREEDLHWDVQHRDGSHTNIDQDGEVDHGDDNFP
jgi:hypothetical protein